eukprot:6195019-Pleurochrysis_carterae.AAC.3
MHMYMLPPPSTVVAPRYGHPTRAKQSSSQERTSSSMLVRLNVRHFRLMSSPSRKARVEIAGPRFVNQTSLLRASQFAGRARGRRTTQLGSPQKGNLIFLRYGCSPSANDDLGRGWIHGTCSTAVVGCCLVNPPAPPPSVWKRTGALPATTAHAAVTCCAARIQSLTARG